MTYHMVYILTRTPGPVKVAVCSCGWESTSHTTAMKAIHDRSDHLAEKIIERAALSLAPRP